ncbi:hypothetical protein SAMCCGM7_pB0279 (plasmid) [Sinorhizobium americanum CCGM7]|nr:hypothetical protein SAMCCGM7_pB0279 [Sinorhizobium americanum CCGM7]
MPLGSDDAESAIAEPFVNASNTYPTYPDDPSGIPASKSSIGI